MIPYKYRFHGHSSLSYVYSRGDAQRSRLLTLKYVANKHREFPRIAVVVSKKIVKQAVGRNRIRRRLYEYMRTQIPKFNTVYDVVLIASSAELRELPYDQLTAQLDDLLNAAHLVDLQKN